MHRDSHLVRFFPRRLELLLRLRLVQVLDDGLERLDTCRAPVKNAKQLGACAERRLLLLDRSVDHLGRLVDELRELGYRFSRHLGRGLGVGVARWLDRPGDDGESAHARCGRPGIERGERVKRARELVVEDVALRLDPPALEAANKRVPHRVAQRLSRMARTW